MKAMKALFRFFYFLLAWPFLFYSKVKWTFANPSRRFLRLPSKTLIVMEGRDYRDYLTLFLSHPFPFIQPLNLISHGLFFSDEAPSEQGRYVYFIQKDEDYLALAHFLEEHPFQLLLIANDRHYGFLKRVHWNVGEIQSPSGDLIEEMRLLSKQRDDYRKYHAFGIFHLKDFTYDLARLLVLSGMSLLYPTHYLYESKAAKKNRHVKGKGIAISNHTDFADAEMLPRLYKYRRIRMLVGAGVYRVNGPLMHWALKRGGCVKVNEDDGTLNDAGIQGLVISLDLLGVNSLLGAFPEGRINKDGKISSLKRGAAYLSLQSGAPLYPSVTLLPYRMFHRQYVVVGEALFPTKKDTHPSAEEVGDFSKKIEEKLKGLESWGHSKIKR